MYILEHDAYIHRYKNIDPVNIEQFREMILGKFGGTK